VLQGRRTVDSSGGTVALGLSSAGAYRPVALASVGSIAGRITVAVAPDTIPPDSTTPALDTISASTGGRIRCDASAAPTEAANALVWVEGVEAGKPLPAVRRGTLSIEDCRFEPRVMAVPAGTTINLFSGDRATYTTRFYREGAAEPVAVAHTVDAGQVVPSEKIASQAGLVEARRVDQQWAHAYLAVFDHPYFAVADNSGNFRIDSLPPGTYTVKVWREGLEKPVEQRVTVTPSGTGKLDLTLPLPNAEPVIQSP
jgi:hypothetical protein